MSRGRYGFSLHELREEFKHRSNTAIKQALNRLTNKGKVLSIFRGYYLIVPPQYSTRGVLPPTLFLDSLMTYLEREYYLGLLSAAALHGASHQQPQEYFVVTEFPVLRPTQKKGLKINYLSIRQIPQSLLEKQKTETGFLTVSNPALTAADLIQYEKRIGGLNRAATVLNELVDEIEPCSFNPDLLEHVHVTTIQRLGYILEDICHNQVLSEALFKAVEIQGLDLYRIPLKSGIGGKGHTSSNRWNVIVNTDLEIDT